MRSCSIAIRLEPVDVVARGSNSEIFFRFFLRIPNSMARGRPRKWPLSAVVKPYSSIPSASLGRFTV